MRFRVVEVERKEMDVTVVKYDVEYGERQVELTAENGPEISNTYILSK